MVEIDGNMKYFDNEKNVLNDFSTRLFQLYASLLSEDKVYAQTNSHSLVNDWDDLLDPIEELSSMANSQREMLLPSAYFNLQYVASFTANYRPYVEIMDHMDSAVKKITEFYHAFDDNFKSRRLLWKG
jgi:hypothetical protein